MKESETAELEHVIADQDAKAIVKYLEGLPWGDRILAISRLDPAYQDSLMLALTPMDAAELVEALPDETAADLMERLPPEQAADIVEEMSSDQRADLLASMDEPENILQSMDPEDAADTRALSSYDQDVAGGLMITEFLSYELHQTVAQVISDLRENANQYADFNVQYLYVINKDSSLAGVMPIRELLFARQETPVSQLIKPAERTVEDTASLPKLKDIFEECSFSALPVIDRFGRMVGVVVRSAIEEAQTEQAEKDYMSAQGIVGGEEVRTLPYPVRAKRRLSWLFVNVLLNLCGASVIAAHSETLAAAISLAIFLPIISDMSGSSGNQAIGVTIRELSLGLVRPSELFRVLKKELAIGLTLGITLGLLVAAIAWFWKGNPYLGIVVGSALTLNIMIGVCLGGTLPLVLKRMGFDPALSSGLILTTITDMCGFFMVLTFAGWVLGRL